MKIPSNHQKNESSNEPLKKVKSESKKASEAKKNSKIQELTATFQQGQKRLAEIDYKKPAPLPIMHLSSQQNLISFNPAGIASLKINKLRELKNESFFSTYRDVIYEFNISVTGIHELVRLESDNAALFKSAFKENRIMILDGNSFKHFGDYQVFEEKSPQEIFNLDKVELPAGLKKSELTFQELNEEEKTALTSLAEEHLLLLKLLSTNEEKKSVKPEAKFDKASSSHIEKKRKASTEDQRSLASSKSSPHAKAAVRKDLNPKKFAEKQAKRLREAIGSEYEVHLAEIRKQRIQQEI